MRTPVSLSSLTRVLVTLRPSRAAYLIRGFLRLGEEHRDDVPLSAQVQLVLADWMAHLGCLDEGQQQQILLRLTDNWREWSAELGEALDSDSPLPGFTITLIDGRFVTSSGMSRIFDLHTDSDIDALPEPAVTFITCDLTAAYARCLRRMKHTGEPEHVAHRNQPRGVAPAADEPR